MLISLFAGFSPLSLVSLFVQGAGTMMQMQSQKQALQVQQMQTRFQERQYKAEADAAVLEAQEKENKRRKEYFENLSANRALMAQSGITLDSPSYRAFLQGNYSTYKKDASAISLAGKEKQLASYYNIQQTKLSGKADKIEATTNRIATLGKGLMRAYSTIEEG